MSPKHAPTPPTIVSAAVQAHSESMDFGTRAASREIRKIAGVILWSRRLLVVCKRSAPGVFIMPGGKPEPGEHHWATLARELGEELTVSLVTATHMGSYRDVAHFEKVPICMDVYIAEISGVPQPQSEIAGLRWINSNYAEEGVAVGSVLSAHVVPELVRRDLI